VRAIATTASDKKIKRSGDSRRSWASGIDYAPAGWDRVFSLAVGTIGGFEVNAIIGARFR
jgi:hypothetical protein